ncbi:hypothetical protein B0919_14440 [Hymenobacter sp. CRA2]|nr:hypothetical protein B0919_14440 [Hymenobacter sp. CRA2]
MLPLASHAQTTAFGESFEGGLGSFIPVNGTQVNQWHAGRAAGNGGSEPGSQAAYISNNGGTGHAYDTNATSIAHLYSDVTLPAGNVFELSFDWQNQGEPGERDYLKVYLVPTSFTPTAGALPAGSGVVPITPLGLCQRTGFGHLTLPLPVGATTGPTTVRLVFTWANNIITGTQPPAAIDNVTVTAQTALPLPAGTYTVDNSQPASATNFSSLAAAIQRLNQAPPAGAVTFEVAAGQTFAQELPPLLASGTPTQRIVFRKAGSGANPVVLSNGGPAAIDVVGSDFVTFDGIDVRAVGPGPVCGYRVRGASATDGTRGIVVRNAAITLNRATPGSVGLLQATGTSLGTAAPTDSLGTHRNNRYLDLTISNAVGGLWLVSSSSTYPDNKTEVANVAVGNGTPGDIGNTGLTYGIRAENQRQLSVHDNVIRGVQASAASVYGLYTLALQGSGAAACRIYNNRISDIRFNNPTSGSTAFSVNGMVLDPLTGTTAGSTTIYCYNNEINDLRRDYAGTTTTPSRLLRGLQITTLGNANNNQIMVWHNTVAVGDPAAAAFSNVTLEFAGSATSGGLLDVRNNIFVNTTASQSAGKHYAYFALNPSAGPVGSTVDYNNLYLTDANGGILAHTTTADYTSLADWRAASGQEVHSLSVDPRLATTSPLLPGNPALDNQGTPLAGVATDLAGTPRNRTAPDMGAYEFTVLSNRLPRRAQLGLTAYPVPFTQALTVRLTQALPAAATLQLVDALGRLVCQASLPAHSTQLTLPGLAALPSGAYVLRFITADGQQQALPLLH